MTEVVVIGGGHQGVAPSNGRIRAVRFDAAWLVLRCECWSGRGLSVELVSVVGGVGEVQRCGFLSDSDPAYLGRFPLDVNRDDLVRCFSLGGGDGSDMLSKLSSRPVRRPPE